MSEDELTESAFPRHFAVEVTPKYPKPGAFQSRVMMVQGHSIKEAKHNAFRKLAKGRYQYIQFSQIKFVSVQDLTNQITEEMANEPSNS